MNILFKEVIGSKGIFTLRRFKEIHLPPLIELLRRQLHRLIHLDAAVLGAEFLHLLIEPRFLAGGQ